VRIADALHQADALRRGIAKLPATPSRAAGDAIAAFSGELEAAAGPSPDAEEYFDEHALPPTNLRRIGAALARYERTVESADAAPTRDAEAALPQFRAETAVGLTHWSAFLKEKLPAVNAALRGAGIPPLTLE